MNSLVSEGLNLMVYGMGFVFVFLTLLVFVTGLASKLVTKYLPEPVVTAKPKAKAAPVGATANNDQLTAVIAAAVHKYRK